jgi:hypothetical protein
LVATSDQQVLAKRGVNTLLPVKLPLIWFAATLAWLLAEKPDLGIDLAIEASPKT